MPFFRKSKEKQASTYHGPTLPSKATQFPPSLPPAQSHSQFYQHPQCLSQQHLSSSPFQPQHQATQPQPQPYRQESGPYQYGHNAAPVSSSNLLLPPPPYPPKRNEPSVHRSKWSSCADLASTLPCPYVQSALDVTTEYLNRGTSVCDLISNKFADVITLIDEEIFPGSDRDLILSLQSSPPPPYPAQVAIPVQPTLRGGRSSQTLLPLPTDGSRSLGNKDCVIRQAAISQTSNVFAKANLYANSRLPTYLPPLHVYLPTWRLLYFAAETSQNAYNRPQGAERNAYVDGQWRLGTKAMVIKSVPMDEMNVIFFAIRGTVGIMDWAVNLRDAPASPSGFLDDPGNLCHAGFLDVARKMIKPFASRLRQLLEENPSRAACSLMITGHSAGGAVAALLYCHMLCESVRSELNILTGCFKRVHCVTFGAPPVSLLPLAKPIKSERRLRNSLFYSIINEGDPVARADKAYVRSLLELYKSPAPSSASKASAVPNTNALASTSRLNLSLGALGGDKRKLRKKPQEPERPTSMADRLATNMVWEVPQATLSNAGRLVALRVQGGGSSNGNNQEDIGVCTVTDEQLRQVVFGDPLMHQMKVYSNRIDVLATRAMKGR